jgi:nucleoside-diphosphate-sugar epimerase
MRRYLVTGAQGFVGRYFVSHILGRQPNAEIHGIGRSPEISDAFTHRVTWIDRLVPAPLPDTLVPSDAKRYRYTVLDIHHRQKLAAVIRELQPHVVVHLASGLRDDALASLLRINVEGTVDLLEAIVESGRDVEKIVLGSTGGVYGIPDLLPLDEQAACNPIDQYSTSKLAAEHMSRILAHRYRLPAIWARLFNLAGPGQDERHICGRFASKAAAIAEGLLPARMDVEALNTTRDFIDVRDVASALATLCECGEPGNAYNVASGCETDMKSVLDLTLQAAGLTGRVEIENAAKRVVDIPRHFASVEKLRGLAFHCAYSLRDTVADTVAYYRMRGRA